MSDGVEVQFEGVDELVAGTRKLAKGISDEAPREFQHVADQVASQVRGILPRRTGALAGSVDVKRESAGAGVEMGNGIRYAQFVEYGGRGFPRSAKGNYLTPTALDAEPQLVAAAGRTVNREIGDVNW